MPSLEQQAIGDAHAALPVQVQLVRGTVALAVERRWIIQRSRGLREAVRVAPPLRVIVDEPALSEPKLPPLLNSNGAEMLVMVHAAPATGSLTVHLMFLWIVPAMFMWRTKTTTASRNLLLNPSHPAFQFPLMPGG